MIVSKYPQSRQKNCSARENDVALYRGGWLEGQSPLSIKWFSEKQKPYWLFL